MKIRGDTVVRGKAVCWPWEVLPERTCDILGLWIENTKGAKFWRMVFNALDTRGVHDLIEDTDGSKGMAEALVAIKPL